MQAEILTTWTEIRVFHTLNVSCFFLGAEDK